MTSDAKRGSDEVELVPPGGSFEGLIFCRGTTRIEGRVRGPIHSRGLLSIGVDAEVRGAVEAETLALAGSLEGAVTAETRVAVADGATLRGTLSAPSLKVEAGAVVDGACRIHSPKADADPPT